MVNYRETNEFNIRSKIDLLFLTLGLSAPSKTNSSPQSYIHTIILPKSKCLCPLNSYIKILIPKNEVLGGGALGRYVGHEGGAFMNGISVLKRATRELPHPDHLVRTQREDGCLWTKKWALTDMTMLVPCSLNPSLQNYDK